MARLCRRFLFRGRVQGVGFRFTAQRLARGYDVSGHVRNLDDGRVEVVADGDEAEIQAFIKAITDAFQGKIEGNESESLPAEIRTPQGFVIRY